MSSSTGKLSSPAVIFGEIVNRSELDESCQHKNVTHGNVDIKGCRVGYFGQIGSVVKPKEGHGQNSCGTWVKETK